MAVVSIFGSSVICNPVLTDGQDESLIALWSQDLPGARGQAQPLPNLVDRGGSIGEYAVRAEGLSMDGKSSLPAHILPSPGWPCIFFFETRVLLCSAGWLQTPGIVLF